MATFLNKAFKYFSDKIKFFTGYDFNLGIQSDTMKDIVFNKDLVDDSDEEKKIKIIPFIDFW